MPIPSTTYDDLVQHLSVLGLHSNQAVAVHSKLLSFGRIVGGVEVVYAALREILGPGGTLVFPAYTLNLLVDDFYDPANTPSHAVGVLPEYVRTLKGVRRSACPMHGHIAIGPLAELVMQADPSFPLGQNSEFSVMHENKFHLLLLGCNFQEGATFIHHVEAEVGVPYRSWLNLSRQCVNHDGSQRAMTCRYYGHTAYGRYLNNLVAVERHMDKRGLVAACDLPLGRSLFMPLTQLYKCVADLLLADPYVLVTPVSENQ